MTQFEVFWLQQRDTELLPLKSEFEKVWHAAQRALLRTIADPPFVPKTGDKVRFLSLCHPNLLGKVKEVTDVEHSTLKIYRMGTTDGDTYSYGILGEVEKVVEEESDDDSVAG